MPKEKQRGESDADFSAAAHFAAHFGRLMMRADGLTDVDVLKIDVPSSATAQTPWRVTRLSRSQYYVPVSPGRERLSEPVRVDFEIRFDPDRLEPDSDVYAVRVAREISVTPLSLDMTSRVDLEQLGRRLSGPGRGHG
jgi:5'-nucleotidase